MGIAKTNAMRILESKNLEYSLKTYDAGDGKIDGVSVAEKTGLAPETVFKTLVARSGNSHFYVFVVPIEDELDLKKAAQAAGAKKVEMLPVKELQKVTGYIRGGCSPVGMKKLFPTFIDCRAEALDKMAVSGGRIGVQIIISPSDLKKAVKAQFKQLTKNIITDTL
ncbi:Cys-tRNA(Pro) deacylase [Peribacillus sp. B-H-3]|uniref:Cys-tRNA(Pro) deacylase n=1 Tax=Peribacillus sp. B-H-3 TaxID=3400420 RepID=UPI003B01AD2C